MNLNSKIKEYAPVTEDAIKRYINGMEGNETLKKAMLYSVTAGGKRLRSSMVLAACEMLGGKIEEALPLACALETIHTYSLIHDDLPALDNDDLRRGKPSNHKVFGEAMAILAGDGLLSTAFEMMVEGYVKCGIGHDGYVKAMRYIARAIGARGMVSGQACDIENETNQVFTEEMLKHIHSNKTGALIKASVVSGALAANAKDSDVAALEEFGEQYGLLFQITDDILDFEGDEAVLGKSTGKDSKSNKLTYVTLFGAARAHELAGIAAENAKKAVSRIDGSEFFTELVDHTIGRNR